MRFSRTHAAALTVVVALLASLTAVGQGIPTGTINGKVLSDGAGLPGVTVTAKSASLQGSRMAVTSGSGEFALLNLTPGEYTVTFEISGFEKVTKSAKVAATQTTEVNTTMSLAGQTAEVVVTAQSEAISRTSTASSTITADTTQKLPLTRTLLSTVVLAPGVNTGGPAGNVTISGAQSFDNQFTINGVNVQDNIRGTPANTFIEDAIQETTVSTSGVSAEYGRFTGGIINAITKSGGNAFSGSLRASLDNDKWAAKTPLTTTRTDKVVPTYEATLGGPIWRDRVWFFAAGRHRETEFTGQTNAYTGRAGIPFDRGETDQRIEGKLTLTPFQNHTLTGSYFYGNRDQTGYYFPSIPILTLDQVYDRQLPESLTAINYSGVLSSSFIVEAQYSRRTFEFKNSGSRFTDLIEGTAVYFLDIGAMTNSPVFCGVCDPETRDNDDYLVKGTYFLTTDSIGSHQIVGGYDNFGSQRKSNNYQSGNSYWFYPTEVIFRGNEVYGHVDSSSYLEYWPIPNLSKGSDVRTHSVFVNDVWRLGKNLSFNLGLRWDKNDATDSAGAKTANDSAFSPRLAATYDFFGDGKLKVTGAFARYVGQIQETQVGASSSFGSPAYYQYYWLGPEINADPNGPLLTIEQMLAQVFAGYGITAPGQFPDQDADFVSVPGVNVKFRDTLESPSGDEYVLGVSGTVGRGLVYRVDGVHRKYRDFYDLQRNIGTGKVTDQLGRVFDLGFVVNSNIPEREYTGLHTSMAFRAGGLSTQVNWTWSHTIGNFVGETSGSGPVRAGYQNYPEYFDLKWNAPRGDLSQDQRHRVRLLASYDFKLGSKFMVSPGLVQSFETGLPYEAVGSVNTRTYVTNPGYQTPPTSVSYYFTPRGAFRTDDVWRTDLSLNLSYNLGPVEIFAQPQVWNLFNADSINPTPGSINTSVITRTTGGAASGLQVFNPFTTTPVEGTHWRKGANFGKPTAIGNFQQSRLIRFTMGVRF